MLFVRGCLLLSVLFFGRIYPKYLAGSGVIISAAAEICELTDDLSSCYKKFMSFEALGQIHKYLDDDKNGEVDSKETEKFVREEYSLSERSKKPRLLSDDDPLVSLDDLWAMWRKNPAFNWDAKQTLRWLSENVELPQYEDMFTRHAVDGKSLPLLAMQNMSYLTNVLLIRNPIHKRKLMLKALDAILFGPPPKKVLISTQASVVTASLGFFTVAVIGFTHWMCHSSSDDKRGSSSNTDTLTGAEQALKQLQQNLEELERIRCSLNNSEVIAQLSNSNNLSDPKQSVHRNGDTSASSNPSSIDQQSVEQRKITSSAQSFGEKFSRIPSGTQLYDHVDWDSGPVFVSSDLTRESSVWNLSEVEEHFPSRRLIQTDSAGWTVSAELRLWLQLTYALEVQEYKKRKTDAEAQLNITRQACKRLHKKRYNILGSVRLIHSDSLDELEQRLLDARMVLEHLQEELRERSIRWARIESLVGSQLRSNLDVTKLRHLLSLSTFSSKTQSSSLPVASSLTSKDLPSISDHYRQSSGEFTHPITIPSDDSGGSSHSVEFDDQFHLKDPDSNAPRAPAAAKLNIPRNYSFVRPFANLWRHKAGVRLHGVGKKP
ncbi:unnamed protein product [Calicophoron daubneyi]|uniref:SAM domain-containing protein n=1 Tax=Calicophoron daubneyi TaxID=300641 RepID=A0AAV2TDY7_CALDB